jgi:hypothetical protein
MQLLNIVSSGYRATIEEQDDTVVWITHCLRNAGADVDMLLCGAASNYPVLDQSVAPVTIGGRQQKHGPDVLGQVRELAGAGSTVFVVREDLEKRSIDQARLLPNVQVIRREQLPELIKGYDRVWHW